MSRGGAYYRAKYGNKHQHDGLPSEPYRAGGGNVDTLEGFFSSVDGDNYGVLKQLTNRTFSLRSTAHAGLSLTFLAIQSDPFAPGSQVCVHVPAPFTLPRDAGRVLGDTTVAAGECDLLSAGIVECGQTSGEKKAAVDAHYNSVAQVAAEDYVLRCVHRGLPRYHRSGALQFLRPSQHVLPRSAVALDEDGRELRLHLRVKLPGHGRRIDGRGAVQILVRELQVLVEACVCGLSAEQLLQHVVSVQDQEWLRHQLRARRLVAFVADGAVLPRVAGDSDLPLPGAVPFASPASLSVHFDLPFSGRRVQGMGLPRGLTLIAGGGFHGKSTLLRALELGVYNHESADGRTFVAVDPTAVKIRAEDRRAIHGVDISPFIGNLPFQKDTTAFATADASGSTSQAANIMEALELGSSALLLDEDTSATNFMYRDAMMQQLVPPAQEPITPFVERVRELVVAHDVSAVIVVGGSGQYFKPADVVLVLNCYKVSDCTTAAKAIVASSSSSSAHATSASVQDQRRASAAAFPGVGMELRQRQLLYSETFDFIRPRKGRDSTKISGLGLDTIRVSDEDINVGLVEQLVEEGQLNGIAQCIALLYDVGAVDVERAQGGWMAASSPLYPPTLSFARAGAAASLAQQQQQQLSVTGFHQLIANVERQLRVARLELQQPSCYLPVGFTSLPRVFEIAAALNRLRTLRTCVK